MNPEDFREKIEEKILKEIKQGRNIQKNIAYIDCLIWISEIYIEMLEEYLEELYGKRDATIRN